MRPFVPLVLLLLGPVAHATPLSPVAVARLAPSTGEVVEPLTAALQSPDALTRATAARVAAIRGEKALVPVLHDALTNETNADAAREEIRALVLTGTDDDIGFAVQAAVKFPPRMDGVLADAVARLGSRGISLYPKYVRPLRRIGDESNFFRLALWQPTDYAPEVAATPLSDNDERGWCELIDGAGDASTIAPTAFATALGSGAPNIRATTAHCLLHRYAADKAHLPEALRDVVTAPLNDGASPDETLTRELLRRAAGAAAQENDVAPLLHDNCAFRALFTSAELFSAHCDNDTA